MRRESDLIAVESRADGSIRLRWQNGRTFGPLDEQATDRRHRASHFVRPLCEWLVSQ